MKVSNHKDFELVLYSQSENFKIDIIDWNQECYLIEAAVYFNIFINKFIASANDRKDSITSHEFRYYIHIQYFIDLS